ncbi:hypothetical protein [Labrys sp. 22185]|uniref:hypothetical protein n=1 Tax=Labrys sp. 22185 TaxID=3453888 RepID=UPI003F87EB81
MSVIPFPRVGLQKGPAALLPPIPIFDARDSGLALHAQARLDTVRALLRSCLISMPAEAHGKVAELDAGAHAWLLASPSPYVGEIEAIAALLPMPGAFLINAAYEWGCTTLAAAAPDGRGARLLRTLDWDFDGLGRFVEVVRQRGPAGEFLNVTWPGAVGVLTALAPGRFAATINKGPTPAGAASASGAIVPDLSGLRRGLMPAMHLLRRVFEEAPDFATARDLMERIPIAAETIFTLTGLSPAETCVIERRPEAFVTQPGPVAAANDWANAPSWNNGMLCESDSPSRRLAIASHAGRAMAPFAWVEPPLRNAITRLAVEADARQGSLRVRGYEATPDRSDAMPVTADLELQV